MHIAAAPNVAAQAEYWYEDERVQLAERVGTQIDVFVDPAVHPERPRIVWGDENLPAFAPIRVGDEFEVELLHTRLPNATAAAAIVAGRLIEVENAANAAGKTIKIRIIDVDGSDILAEPRTRIEAATAIGEGRGAKKRRRGGRGRKRELTPAEQAAELRELAEEAEKGLGGRTSIGISTVEEVDAKAAKPKTTAQKAADGRVTTLLPPQKVADGRMAAVLPGESLSGSRTMLPGEKLSGDRVGGSGSSRPAAVPIPMRPPTTPAAAEAAGESEGEEAGHRRRRRRRRGGRGGSEVAANAAAPAAIASPFVVDAELEDDEEDAAVAGQNGAALGENGERKRRRRRRRRRGRGPGQGEGQVAAADSAAAGAPSGPAAVPDRHIFRVSPGGGAQATGETAPPTPSRAIAPWNRKRGDVAVEPPPPVITAPKERAEPVKAARPSRTRRGSVAEAPARRGQLEAGAPVRALPAPAPAAGGDRPAAAPAASTGSGEVTAPRRGRARPRGTASAPPAAPAVTTAAPAAAPVEKKPRARKASPPAAASAKKATAVKTTAAKKTAAKKPAAAPKKAASARKAPAAKKATTTRKKS